MVMRNTDFAVFILTHGRADRVYTYPTIRRAGYTGKIFIIIDSEDKEAEKYKHNFGNEVVVFDKKLYSGTFDECDNFDNRRGVVYARNACFDIAKELGITYFMQLDDDYREFYYQYGDGENYKKIKTRSIDDIFDVIIDFYKDTNIKSISIGQGGDYIGGKENDFGNHVMRRRKCMNSFLCSTERRFPFVGRINEDVNVYVWYQSMGDVFLTVSNVALMQVKTQTNPGGQTDLYMDSGGTYVKSFYTVLCSPSSVKINVMGQTHRRIHHSVSWNNAVPCIISEDYRKASVNS